MDLVERFIYIIIGGIVFISITMSMYFFFDSIRKLRYIIRKKYEIEANTKSLIARRFLHENVINKKIRPTYDKLNELKLQLDKASRKTNIETSLQAVFKQVEAIEEEVRNISSTLYPPLLTKFFVEACKHEVDNVTKSNGFEGEIQFTSNGDFNNLDSKDLMLYNLFSLIDLFVTNSVKHSKAALVEINVQRKENLIMLRMADDGKGFDLKKVEKQKSNRGVADIRGLAIALNPLRYDFESILGKGTFFEMVLNLDNE